MTWTVAGWALVGMSLATMAVSEPSSASQVSPPSPERVVSGASTKPAARPVELPPAAPPYYRVRYEPSGQPGELILAVNYTVWIPPGVKTLRGVIVHQHGCGDGACRESVRAAYDLHWQALARKWDCALIGPTYEHTGGQECASWCVPAKGSERAFLRGLGDLAKMTGHAELETAPWVLWGHSGGANWSGQMTLRQPERVAAVWMRSGAPYLSMRYSDATTRPVNVAALREVPMMSNAGVKEQTGQFAYVWKAVSEFTDAMRAEGMKIGWAPDPDTAHDCGNSRYLAIPWLDACMAARLPAEPGGELRSVAGGQFGEAGWLPRAELAPLVKAYVATGRVPDETPPPVPTGLKVADGALTWDAEADLESGLAGFVIYRDEVEIARLPAHAGKPSEKRALHFTVFQGLMFHDTPRSLPVMRYEDTDKGQVGNGQGGRGRYAVRSLNTAGLMSAPCEAR